MSHAAAFLLTLKRRPTGAPPDDPLAAARTFITTHAETAEAQALHRVLVALACASGEFLESEAWLFGSESAAIAAALIDARLCDRYSEQEWQHACSL